MNSPPACRGATWSSSPAGPRWARPPFALNIAENAALGSRLPAGRVQHGDVGRAAGLPHGVLARAAWTSRICVMAGLATRSGHGFNGADTPDGRKHRIYHRRHARADAHRGAVPGPDACRSEHGLDLIVLDYLQLMRVAGAMPRTVRRRSRRSRVALKALARELKVPDHRAVAAEPQRRATYQDKKPVMSDLRESGAQSSRMPT
jgi:hypothetical protein